MKPKVSIVIPVYNGEKHMREAIDSALNQTYENCEVLVVNDGSTDRTEEIALSYGDKISYFAKENGGVSTALNLGIEKMTGEYFCYLPHDDLFHPEKTEKQIQAILESKDEMTIVWSSCNAYEDETGVRKKMNIPLIYKDKAFLENSIVPLLFSMLISITVIINKKYFKMVGNFNESLFTSQDYDMWFRTFRNRKNIYIEEALSDYRFHKEQGSQADESFMRNCMELSVRMCQSLEETEINRIFGNKYRFYYYMAGYYDLCWKDSKCLDCNNALQDVINKLEMMEKPQEVFRAKELAENYLWNFTDNTPKQIVLYCAGRNARRLVYLMHERGVDIEKLVDSNEEKLGLEIEGVICQPICDEDKDNALVIVTKDEPEELVETLKSEGYKYVVSYDEIAYELYRIMPEKIVCGE